MQILEIKQLSILLENFTDDWDCMVCLHCRLTNTSQIDDVNYGYTLKLQGIPRMQTSLKLVINTYTITYLILSTCTRMILINWHMFLSPQWYSKLSCPYSLFCAKTPNVITSNNIIYDLLFKVWISQMSIQHILH